MRIIKIRRESIILLCSFILLLSCTMDDKAIIQGIFLRPTADNKIMAGPLLPFQPNIITGQQVCEGAAGSFLPPLSLGECANEILMDIPTMIFSGLWSNNISHVELSGIENFFVQQDRDSDCWAAALVTARAYLRRPYIDKNRIIENATKICRGITNNHGYASAYQMLFIMFSIDRYVDLHQTPHLCSSIECIINAIWNKKPVLMLKNNHVVIIVGFDYYKYEHSYKPVRYQIIDPDIKNGNGKIQSISHVSICSADAFIAF